MEVIFVLHNLYGGGAERVTCLVTECLVKKSVSVSIITNTNSCSDYNAPYGVRIIPFFKEGSLNGINGFIQKIKTIRNEMKKHPQAIMVGVMPIAFLYVAIASLFLKNKIVASDHTSFERPLKWHMKFIRNYVYRMADAVTMLTEADAKYLGDKFKDKWVIPNPLAYKPLENLSIIKNNTVLAAGRLDDWYVKGFDLLLESWAKVSSLNSDWTLEIAGKGSRQALDTLKNKVSELGIKDRVLFSGFHKDIDRVMRESSIFVLSSRHEGFGLVLVEAMSQGCACISFDCGGRQKEIIKDEHIGIIVENHDVNELANKLMFLITNESERFELSKNGLKRSESYNVNKIIEIWISMFRHLSK